MKPNRIAVVFVLSILCSACRAPVEAPQATGIAAPEVVEASLASVEAEQSLYLFEYDSTLPLDIIEEGRWQVDGQTWIDFTYASLMGGRVPARLVIPAGEGPFPAIMIQHGSMGHIEDMESPAQLFASLGAVVIMIEDPYSRPGGWQTSEYMGSTWPYYTSQDLEVKIQSIIDMRRAIDILIQRPEVDPDRLAYYGISYGAAMGGLLRGIEDRIQAYVLQVGDGGLVEHTSDPGPDGMPIHFSPGWAELMWPTEPLHFVGRASEAPVLFLNGLQDVNVPPADALRYQTAASEPKMVYWYDADHSLTPQAVIDAAEWLEPYLGTQLLWLAPTYRASAVLLDWAMTFWILSIVASQIVLWRWSRKDKLPGNQRLLWALNVLFIGPLGLVAYASIHRAQSGKRRAALGGSIYSVTALTAGLLVGNIINDILSGVHVGLALLAMYVIFLLGSRLFHRLVWRVNSASWLAHMLVAHIYWAATIVASAWINDWLGSYTLLDARLLWSLGIAFLLGLIVTLPMHVWLLERGLGQWTPQGADEGEEPGFAPMHWAVSLGLGLSSYILVIGSLMWLIAYSTGLSLTEISQALLGS